MITIESLLARRATDDPAFAAWRNSVDDKHWATKDLSALRIGYELGRAMYEHVGKNAGLSTQFITLRAVVRFVLEHAEKFQWELQGLGFLRMHLNKFARIHIWDSRFANPGVSTIHDHLQWGLDSTIIFGRLANFRFLESTAADQHPVVYRCARIRAGVGGGITEELEPVELVRQSPEIYTAGDTYSQRPDEIHESVPDDGTVTVMVKTPTRDTDGARVFWSSGEWVTAEPRIATESEVREITQAALDASHRVKR